MQNANYITHKKNEKYCPENFFKKIPKTIPLKKILKEEKNSKKMS